MNTAKQPAQYSIVARKHGQLISKTTSAHFPIGGTVRKTLSGWMIWYASGLVYMVRPIVQATSTAAQPEIDARGGVVLRSKLGTIKKGARVLNYWENIAATTCMTTQERIAGGQQRAAQQDKIMQGSKCYSFRLGALVAGS